jgi:Flp pilus assembly protein TadD
MNLGISYAQVNRLEEAHDSLQTAIRLAPHLPEPRFNQAVLFAKEGKFQDAERSLSELLSIHPRHEQGRAALENIRRMLRQN